VLCLAQRKIGHEVVAADLPLFIVEVYSPDEIAEARRSFSAASAEDAFLVAKKWIRDSEHGAANFRIIAVDGAIVFDKAITEVK
jgi:hypothetical protein